MQKGTSANEPGAAPRNWPMSPTSGSCSPRCGPCRALGPTIDALADSYGTRVKVGKLNVDEHPAIAAKYGVRSIPTVILFADGTVQDTIIGCKPQQHYASRLDALTTKA